MKQISLVHALQDISLRTVCATSGDQLLAKHGQVRRRLSKCWKGSVLPSDALIEDRDAHFVNSTCSSPSWLECEWLLRRTLVLCRHLADPDDGPPELGGRS